MKKMITLTLATICVFVLVGCSQLLQTENDETTPRFELYRVPKNEAAVFSYVEDAAVYLSDDIEFNGETEIKQTGFYNITKCDIQDTVEAYERAKMECSISYDRVSVFYDSSADMWQVYFFTSETNGQRGDRLIVYLGGDGVTRLIVNFK